MKRSMIFLAVLSCMALNSSITYSAEKPTAKVSKISFFIKHRGPQQHKDRLSSGRK